MGSLDGSRPRHAGYLPPTHVNIGEYWKIRDAAGRLELEVARRTCLPDDMTTRSAAADRVVLHAIGIAVRNLDPPRARRGEVFVYAHEFINSSRSSVGT